MKLRYLVGIAALAYNCVAKTPEYEVSEVLSTDEAQRAFQNEVQTVEDYFCREFTRIYKATSQGIEKYCPEVISAEMDEVCQDYEKLQEEARQSMTEYCR